MPVNLHRSALWGLGIGIFYPVVHMLLWGADAGSFTLAIFAGYSLSLIFHLCLDKVCGRQDIVVALEIAATQPFKEKLSRGEDVTIKSRRIPAKYFHGNVKEMAATGRRVVLLLPLFILILIDLVFYFLSGASSASRDSEKVIEFGTEGLLFFYLLLMAPWLALRNHKDWIYDEIPWLKAIYLASIGGVGCYSMLMLEHFDMKGPRVMLVPIVLFLAFLYQIYRLMWGKRAYESVAGEE